jgi:hypothetical protein
MSTAKQRERAEALVRLQEQVNLRPGDTVYTTVTHVARSGMYRYLRLFVARKGEIVQITRLVAGVLGWKHSEKHGLGVPGAGMCMGFHATYTLGRALFPNGGPLAKSTLMRVWHAKKDAKRAASKAVGGSCDELLVPTRETDGGYLLRQEWL